MQLELDELRRAHNFHRRKQAIKKREKEENDLKKSTQEVSLAQQEVDTLKTRNSSLNRQLREAEHLISTLEKQIALKTSTAEERSALLSQENKALKERLRMFNSNLSPLPKSHTPTRNHTPKKENVASSNVLQATLSSQKKKRYTDSGN